VASGQLKGDAEFRGPAGERRAFRRCPVVKGVGAGLYDAPARPVCRRYKIVGLAVKQADRNIGVSVQRILQRSARSSSPFLSELTEISRTSVTSMQQGPLENDRFRRFRFGIGLRGIGATTQGAGGGLRFERRRVARASAARRRSLRTEAPTRLAGVCCGRARCCPAAGHLRLPEMGIVMLPRFVVQETGSRMSACPNHMMRLLGLVNLLSGTGS